MLRQGILNSHNDCVKLLNRRIVEMTQSMAELATRTGVNSDLEGVVFTKLKYRFIVFLVYFLRYFSVFGILTSLSVTDPGLNSTSRETNCSATYIIT